MGIFNWLIMSFGLSNALSTFQSLMNGIFELAMRIFVLIFFDGILVDSGDWDSCLKHQELVIFTLFENKLYAKSTPNVVLD